MTPSPVGLGDKKQTAAAVMAAAGLNNHHQNGDEEAHARKNTPEQRDLSNGSVGHGKNSNGVSSTSLQLDSISAALDDVAVEVANNDLIDRRSLAEFPGVPTVGGERKRGGVIKVAGHYYGKGKGKGSIVAPWMVPEPIDASGNSVTEEQRSIEAGRARGPDCVFRPDELRPLLAPSLERLYAQEPESLPFRQPVDRKALGITDYFDVVKVPMDLPTIKKKLEAGEYRDPWMYVDDVWRMFNNAWLYNYKTSKVYKHCTKLSAVFEKEIDPVMKALGYCCGRSYTFNPQVLRCYAKQTCTISSDAMYYSYQSSNETPGSVFKRYTYCHKCFNDIPEDSVTIGGNDASDPAQSQTIIKKDEFQVLKNDNMECEAFVWCTDCGRKVHQICVLYMEAIWPQGYTCANCLKKKCQKRKPNEFTAKRLPATKLGTYIETRVNNLLKKKEDGAGAVTIRVVSACDKIVRVKPGMRSRFVDDGGDMAPEFPYRGKAMFAFKEIDGQDVCFFGMHVQEYGSEESCARPNSRRVYIAYLDSVNFFKPKRLRTAVYHEILLSYLDYVKQLGYTAAYIWSCPPNEGEDHIFYCHPKDQRIPKPVQLLDWYKKMLEKGKVEKIVFDYKDILSHAIEEKMASVAELPYFEDYYWPTVLEKTIEELNQQEEERRKLAEAAAAANIFSLDTLDSAPDEGLFENDLSATIFVTMEKEKDSFFAITLHGAESAANLGPIQDPDPTIDCALMDGHEAFLKLAKAKHLEFSSLRRAKFSTMSMLYMLHNKTTQI